MSTSQTSVLEYASDFEILDGHFSSIGRDSSSFTARDVHLTINHHYNSSPTSSNSSSSPNPTNVSNEQGPEQTSPVPQSRRQRSSSEDMTQSDLPTQRNCVIYRTRLYSKGRGLPLWNPEPNQNLPIQCQRQGISLGDVGVVTETGSFILLFNIFLPQSHPINLGKTPEGFKPIRVVLDHGTVLVQRESKDDSYLASPSRLRAEKKEGSANLIFKSSESGGAILTMPVGAKKEDLFCTARLQAYVEANMTNWYRYVYHDRGMDLQNGDLRVVTGCDKTSAWGMACLGYKENPTQESNTPGESEVQRFHLEFGPTTDDPSRTRGGRYRWMYSGEVAEARAGPDSSEVDRLRTVGVPGDVEQQDHGREYYENQCLFLRTMNPMLSKKVWQKLKSEQEGDEVAKEDEEEDNPRTKDRGVDPQSEDRPSGYSGGTNQSSGPESNIPGQSDTEQNLVYRTYSVLSVFDDASSPPSMMFLADHPSKAINTFLLENCSPGVTMAISIDQDWISVLQEDDDILPSPEELLKRILEDHAIYEEEGVVYLQSKDKEETPITSEDQEADEVERSKSTIENKAPDWQFSDTSAETEFPAIPQPLSLLDSMTSTDYSYNRSHRGSGGIYLWALDSPSSSFFGENEDHETPQASSSLSIGDPWDDYYPSMLAPRLPAISMLVPRLPAISMLVPRLPALDTSSSELTTPSSFGIRTPGMSQDIYMSHVFSSDTGTRTTAGSGSPPPIEPKKALLAHPEQQDIFRDVQKRQLHGDFGPFVPQKMYKSYTTSDRKRYVDEVMLEVPMYFKTEHPLQEGILLKDALHSRTKKLVDRDETVFDGCGPSISIRLEWPGYRQWSRQIPTKDFRSPPQPITLTKLAKNIAKCVQRFMQDRKTQPMEDEFDQSWKIGDGPNDIKFDDLMLVSLHHVSLGSWQPNLRLVRPLHRDKDKLAEQGEGVTIAGSSSRY